jgi:Coenzyme PQQ synthesis protein D (PqqD)
VRLISNGKVFRLSRTAGQLLDALDGATVGEALDELAARYPGVDPATLERDTVGILRWLVVRGVLQHDAAPAPAVAEAREPVPVAGP